MSLWGLLRFHWRRNRLPLLPMAVGLGLFQVVLSRMAPMPNETNWMSAILGAAPPQLMALAGSDIAAAVTTSGFLAIGYGHPLFLLLLGLWAVRVSSGALAGEIGRGTMDMIASRPVPRWHQVAAGFATIVAGLVVLCAAAWGATTLGASVRSLGVAATAFLPVAGGGLLLFAAWGAVGLLVSAMRRDGGSAIAWTSALMAFSFALDYLARLWQPIAALRPLSLFRYYEPSRILREGFGGTDVLVLGSVTAVGLLLAFVVFQRRDL